MNRVPRRVRKLQDRIRGVRARIDYLAERIKQYDAEFQGNIPARVWDLRARLVVEESRLIDKLARLVSEPLDETS